jgi:hypothetical protein
MFRFFKQSLLLILPFAFVEVWQITLLSKFTLEVIALLVILYLILSAIKRRQNDAVFFGGSIDVFIFTTIVLLIVLATGNYNSGVFFLLYFLSFGIAFVFEPPTVFVFIIYVAILFTLLGYTQPDGTVFGDNISNYIKLGSLVLLSPLAYFFGRELGKDDKQTKEIKDLEVKNENTANDIEKDVEKVLQEKNLNQNEVETLNEVVEKSKKLRKKPKSK